MDSNEIDFYIKIDEDIKKESHNLQPETYNNIFIVSEQNMSLLLEEFTLDRHDNEKEERIIAMTE
jgi:hypothetical protein